MNTTPLRDRLRFRRRHIPVWPAHDQPAAPQMAQPGCTICIGPILGTILTLGASNLGVSQGAALLAIYSLGLARPFLLVAAFTDHFLKRRSSCNLGIRFHLHRKQI